MSDKNEPTLMVAYNSWSGEKKYRAASSPEVLAAVRQAVESGRIKGEVLMDVTNKNAPVLADGRYLEPGSYLVIPVSEGLSESET